MRRVWLGAVAVFVVGVMLTSACQSDSGLCDQYDQGNVSDTVTCSPDLKTIIIMKPTGCDDSAGVEYATTTQPCPASNVCIHALCWQPCTTDTDCGDGQVCDETLGPEVGLSQGVCVAATPDAGLLDASDASPDVDASSDSSADDAGDVDVPTDAELDGTG
jgi:hypothetical protein